MPTKILFPLIFLVALIAIANPNRVAAGDESLLIAFGEALSKAPRGAEHSLNVSKESNSQENRIGNLHPVLKKALLIAKKLAETVGLAAGMMVVFLVFILSLIPFCSYTLIAAVRREESLEKEARLAEKHPWKTLFIGLLNSLAALVVIRILFHPPMMLLGILFLSYLISKVLDTIASSALELGRILYRGPVETFPYRAAIGALVLWPSFLIPVFGQVLFLLIILRGMGAKIWLFSRNFPSNRDKEEDTRDESSEKGLETEIKEK